MESIADKSTASYYKEPHLFWEVPELLLAIEQGSLLAASSTFTSECLLLLPWQELLAGVTVRTLTSTTWETIAPTKHLVIKVCQELNKKAFIKWPEIHSLKQTVKHRSRAYTQDESSAFLRQKSFKTSRAATWYHSCKFSHQSLKAELTVAVSLQFVTPHFFLSL